MHPRRSCITPLNIPYSLFWHAYHRKLTPFVLSALDFQAANPCDLGAVCLAAAIALASPMFRLDGGQSSTLPSFSPVAGVHSSGLNKRLHLAAKTSDRHRQKPAVISAPLFSCSGALTHASRRGHRRFRGTKNPRASNWRSRDYVTNLGPAGLSLLSPDRLLSLLDVCGCRVSRCSEYLYVRLARTVPHSTVHYSQARASVSNAERPATGLALHGWPLARVRTRP